MSEEQENLLDQTMTSLKHSLLIILYLAFAIFGIGFLAGYLSLHFDGSGKPLSILSFIIVFSGLLITSGSLYFTYHAYKNRAIIEGPLTGRESLNRKILWGSGLLGGIIGVVLVFSSNELGENPFTVFSNAPIHPALAIILAIVFTIVMPIIVYIWQTRASDEQEMHVLRTAAYYAFYLYIIGAPTWWILWRGGLVPEPNGIAIYFITLYTYGAIMLWKKYRG